MDIVTQASLFEGKECRKCNEWKQYVEFSRDSHKKDGLRRICKACDNAKAAAWREANPEQIKAANKKWREENKEKVAADMRAWSKANPDKRKAYMHNWYKKNRESILQKTPVWRKNNPERAAQANAEWRKENAELLKERGREWSRKNRDKIAAKRHNRRAKLANGGTYTAKEWKALCVKYDNTCLRCMEKKVLTVDHVVPVSKGGKNTIDNLQPLCVNCNSAKGVKETDYRKLWQPNHSQT